MRGIASPPIARLTFAAVAVAAVAAAFLRGEHLFGVGCGVVYAVLALGLVWLLARSRTPTGRLSVARVVFVVLFALPVGYAMAFPASINPDVQVVIDSQAAYRQARAELTDVLASDPAYRDLSVSSVRLKVVNFTVRGSLGTRADLKRLRSRIADRCPALGECVLHWDISLRDTGVPVRGLDGDLFQDADGRSLPSQRPPVKLVVEGPFPQDGNVSIEPPQSDFVEPKTLRVELRDARTAKVGVGFLFKGEKDPARRIRLQIRLLDAQGQELGSRTLLASDSRIAAENPVQSGSSRLLMLSPRNSANVKVPLTRRADVRSVELVFVEPG